MRNAIFISHAYPQDNQFSMWLALRLASEGYVVWCDLTKLLGGEDIWRDVEEVLRKATVKFLCVLSKSSNRKRGVLQEIGLAQTVERVANLNDFIIPLRIDNLPHRETNIQLARLNTISFEGSWAPGLECLLQKLEQDQVPKNATGSADIVASWWRSHVSARQGLMDQQEEHLSNWFPIRSLPSCIYFHTLRRRGIGRLEVTQDLPFPAFQRGSFLISFAPAADLEGVIHEPLALDESRHYPLTDFLDGSSEAPGVDRRQARDIVTRLLRLGWESLLQQRELPVYQFAEGGKSFYFVKGMVENDTILFDRIDGKRNWRQVVGYVTLKDGDGQEIGKRYWHYGIQLKPLLHPSWSFVAKPRVLFSFDGQSIWENKDRLHVARRRQCKHWWNADWRDRMLATMAWLAGGSDEITVHLAPEVTIGISPKPMTFASPVSYADPLKSDLPIDCEEEEDWDDLEEEGIE